LVIKPTNSKEDYDYKLYKFIQDNAQAHQNIAIFWGNAIPGIKPTEAELHPAAQTFQLEIHARCGSPNLKLMPVVVYLVL